MKISAKALGITVASLVGFMLVDNAEVRVVDACRAATDQMAAGFRLARPAAGA